ncbi:NTP/NDP exchange transporter [Candidatus Dependentiae bacterium]
MLGTIQTILIAGLGSFVLLLVSLAFMAPSVFMHNKLAVSLWGKFQSKEEVRKFAFLAVIFCFIIGIYWALRPLKDGIFSDFLDFKTYQPWAKILSLIFIVPLIIFYNKLIDKFPRTKLFYILTAGYGIVAILFALIFISPLGIGATGAAAGSVFRSIIGFSWYVYVESFGSLLVALFWAFTTDITLPESAKRGFPMIALLGQMGNILGPKFITAKNLGFVTSSPVVAILAFLIFFVGVLLWIFTRVTPKDQLKGFEMAEAQKIEDSQKKEEPGFLDGLKHLLKHKYLMGIAAIIIFYEIIVTMIDYFFKYTAKVQFAGEAGMSGYLAQYGVWTGIVATLCVLFGINNIQRKLGMKASLVLMPVLVCVAVIALKVFPFLQVAFWIMVLAKAVNYALNQPSLKQAYIPTTKESKYKAQSWIEMFGGRSSKATGSAINLVNGVSPSFYALLSLVIPLGLIGLWIFVAIFVSKKYTTAVRENKVVC